MSDNTYIWVVVCYEYDDDGKVVWQRDVSAHRSVYAARTRARRCTNSLALENWDDLAATDLGFDLPASGEETLEYRVEPLKLED